MVSIFDVKITTKWEVENNISLYLRNILKSWQDYYTNLGLY